MSADVRRVWRTALHPRWLVLLGLVALLCVAFAWLGHWQLDVATSDEHRTSSSSGSAGSAAVAGRPIDQVVRPQQVFRGSMAGRAVTVVGTYDGARQVLVAGKRQGGVEGYWVLAPLRTASGALVPVVRGFVATAGATGAPALPAGEVTVTGTLQPPEPAADQAAAPGAGTLPAADTADLVNRWGGPIYNVLVFAADDPGSTASSTSAASAGAGRLTPVPPPPQDQGGGLRLRNAAYAVQWWLFGAFAVLLWWRMVRQDAIDAAARAAAPDHTKELTAP